MCAANAAERQLLRDHGANGFLPEAWPIVVEPFEMFLRVRPSNPRLIWGEFLKFKGLS
jgi:hypothetical protein